MKVGTQQRTRVAAIAKTKPHEALELVRSIDDPWFRCQALSIAAVHVPDRRSAKVAIDEAFSAANELDEPNRVVTVTARRAMGFRFLLTISVVLALALPAWPCEVVDSGSHEQLVRGATVIVRARAERATATRGPQGVFPVATQVQFRVVAVYKGTLKSETLEFNGLLGPAPAPGAPVVGYDFKRPRSLTASCFDPSYLTGAEYLLLLGADDGVYSRAGELTPYWAAQQPTNERIAGDKDSWLLWVIQQLGSPLPNPDRPASGVAAPDKARAR
jgi:hypothetical protein